ncbi:MAG: hypothetical protein ACK4OO_06370 [bacterium]
MKMRRIATFGVFFLLPLGLWAKDLGLKYWAVTAFRVRHQTEKEYTDVSFRGAPGVLLYTLDNSSVRLGYQVGVRMEPHPNVTLGLTLRSGLYGQAMEMIQRLNNREGLLPAIQELFIHWSLGFGSVEMGKIPQEATPLWDLYAATLQIDYRADDPRDGVFVDRMAALNGARLKVPIGFIALSGVFHTDDVDGFKRINADATVRQVRKPDRYVWLLEGEWVVDELLRSFNIYLLSEVNLRLTGDYGFPYRAAVMTDPDSAYANETLWGVNLHLKTYPISLKGGYAYNWRDSVYTNRFWDGLVTLNLGTIIGEYLLPTIAHRYPQLEEFTGVIRYQKGSQRHEFGIYKGHTVKRFAWHYYLNIPVQNLLIQPRVIVFENEITGFRQRKQWRYEITTYLNF